MQIQNSEFYEILKEVRGDDSKLQACIQETVTKLIKSDTSLKQPGLLLGKVQSGKTRAFIGVIALAFDNGYDLAIILTKGTKALSEQTLQRLKDDKDGFGIFKEISPIEIHDVMSLPDNLPEFLLKKKLILVSKKEDDNLRRLLKKIKDIYPSFRDKKTLIIDDEADFASISFKKNKENGLMEQRKICNQIDEIRKSIKRADFLQVTATPYSLYLQPNENYHSDGLFLPKRPAFTVLLPTHDNYVGGDYYFVDNENENSPAFYLHKKFSSEELEVISANKKLQRADRRSFKIEEAFMSPLIQTFRDSIINFIVGGSIRRLQQMTLGKFIESYSFIIHTDIYRVSHVWQEEVVKKIRDELIFNLNNNPDLFEKIIKKTYDDLKISIRLGNFYLPDFQSVLGMVHIILNEGMLFIQVVNSEKDVKSLLDEKGQLRLLTPLNIFIGGQMLDRGITIKNIIGFFYGRNPKKFQQDTVLQHSRMYGSRSKEDLTVTRFYTTQEIYEIMRTIHEFDDALRQAFLNGSHEHGIYFIRSSSGKIMPCSPNKMLLSNTKSLVPYKRFLPIGFQTKNNIKEIINEFDKEIFSLKTKNSSDHFLVPIEKVYSLLDKIKQTLIFEKGYEWDVNTYKAILKYLIKNPHKKNSIKLSQRGKIWVVIRSNSNISQKRSDGKFSDNIVSGTGETALIVARRLAENIPALILIRQNGEKEYGWKGSPFWWPMIMTPKNTNITMFESGTHK